MKSPHLTAVLLAGLTAAWTGCPCRARADEIRGVVAGVDPDKHELRVDGRGPARGTTLTFTLDDKTLVLFGVDKAALSDISAGRRVRVEYDEGPGGRRVARVVRVAGRPPAASGPASGPRPPAAARDGINGVLLRVSRAEREVVVVGPGKDGPETETTVAVPLSAKVVKEGKPSSLEALKVGDAVAVRAERGDRGLVAVEIQTGAGAALSDAKPAERARTVQRLRLLLHAADEVLRRMDPDGDGRPRKPAQP